MKWDCARTEDAISDWTRGAELPDEARRHIAQCMECAKVLEEAKAFHELVQCADSVPNAPDCRAAVMARLPEPKSAWRFAWAAVPMAVIVVLIMLLTPARHAPSPQAVVKKTPPVQQHAPAPKVDLPAPEPEKIAAEPEKVAVKTYKPRHDRMIKRTVVRKKEVVPVQKQAVPQPPKQPEEVCKVKPSEPDTPPVAMIYVTWDKPSANMESKCVVTESKTETTPEQILMNGGTEHETTLGG